MVSFLKRLASPRTPSNAGTPPESMLPTPIGETPIPPLQLRETRKSLYTVYPEAIQSCGQVDVYVGSDKNQGLIVLDEQLAEVREFDPLGKPISDYIYPNKEILKTHAGAKYVADNSQTAKEKTANMPAGGFVCYTKDLPVQLKGIVHGLLTRTDQYGDPKYADHYMSVAKTYSDKAMEESTNLKPDWNRSITLTPEGKYIIVSNVEGKFVAYAVLDDAGRTLPPRQWKRYTNEMNTTYPPDLERHLSILVETPRDDIMFMKDKYAVRATPGSVEILDMNRPPYETAAFIDKTPQVGKNVCVNPSNNSTVYFCRGDKPADLTSLDTSLPSDQWMPQSMHFPTTYEKVNKLQMDPSGNFFVLDVEMTKTIPTSTASAESREVKVTSIVFLNRDTLEEVYRIENFKMPHFDGNGKLRAITSNGYLVEFDGNMQQVGEAMATKRVHDATAGFKVKNVLAPTDKAADALPADVVQRFAHLAPEKERHEKEFQVLILQIRSVEDVPKVKEEFKRLRETLTTADIPPEGIDFMTVGIDRAINLQAQQCAEAKAVEVSSRIQPKLLQELSLAGVSDITLDMAELDKLTGYLSVDTQAELGKMRETVQQKTHELFKLHTAEVVQQANAILDRVRAQIQTISDPASYERFHGLDYPQIISELGTIDKLCPPQITEAHEAIQQAWAQIRREADLNVEKFTKDYGKMRETATVVIKNKASLISQDIKSLIQGAQLKGFKARTAAEAYFSSSKVRDMIAEQIAALKTQDPAAAEELEFSLNVSIANMLGEVERGTYVEIAATGQQMVRFGDQILPKWEAHVKEKTPQQVQLNFKIDENSKTAGSGPDQWWGDIVLNIKHYNGKTEEIRLFESFADESRYRYGFGDSDIMRPSYMTGANFKTFRNEFMAWRRGDDKSLRLDYENRIKLMREHFAQQPQDRKSDAWTQWRGRYDDLTGQWTTFLKEHPIALLRRIDSLTNAPETEYANGNGYVPEWNDAWTRDEHTERNLERIAKAVRLQLDLKSGFLDMVGHAGTGKDVALDILCHETNRPIFATDCSKWTTEAELSEDVFLEARDGATQTIKVPSATLNGITTPGAVVYFNEFSAMPHPGQIFLHALFDHKRAITLKTRSGKVIRAADDVVFASSRNENYPGLFDPGFATLSRAVTVRFDYPPLTTHEPTSQDPNPPYDASEALRIARGVKSLKTLTIDSNLDSNVFVRVFNQYINLDRLAKAPKLLKEQQKDLEVVAMLVQSAAKFRNAFSLFYDKSQDARKSIPVKHPLTGRELSFCAWDLSQMNPEEKNKRSADEIARFLLTDYFVNRESNTSDRQKILTAMQGWSLEKRVVA